jgi:hypothetical protein
MRALAPALTLEMGATESVGWLQGLKPYRVARRCGTTEVVP